MSPNSIVPDLHSAVQHAMLETPAAVDSVAKYSKPLAKALETTNVMSRGHQVRLHKTGSLCPWPQGFCLLACTWPHLSPSSSTLNAAGMSVSCLTWNMAIWPVSCSTS